jgi:dual specificity phosphatase 12
VIQDMKTLKDIASNSIDEYDKEVHGCNWKNVFMLDWVDKKLAISGYIENYDTLTELGITTVINVMAEQHDDIRALSKRGISYYWIPIVDYMCPRSHQIRTFQLIMDMNNKEKVLLHCELGIGRSAFFAVVYLIDKYKLSLDEAIAKLKEIRPMVSFSPSQMEKLRKIYE